MHQRAEDREAWQQLTNLRGRDGSTADAVDALVDHYAGGDPVEVTFQAMDVVRAVEDLAASPARLGAARGPLRRLIATGQ